MTDFEAMQKAIQLALKGSGYVSPNPRVGAVILDENDNIISEGWHKEFGDKHAEIDAIANSTRDSFEGCTMVVNLEPCTHEGKTPPCAPQLIEKKFSKVVIGMEDPNPLVAGSGIRLLKEAGIEVVSGVMEEECKWINRFFSKHITTGMPYIIAKMAQTIDGCIATKLGSSKWITCDESRKRGHALRAQVDAILIGRNTAAKDNPQLTVRNVEGRNPKRIVFDTNLNLLLDLNIFKGDLRENTIVCCSATANPRKIETLNMAGLTVKKMETNEHGKIDLEKALKKLAEECGVTSILVEGGAALYSSFFENDLIDEYHVFIAPKVFGNGINTFNNIKTSYVNQAKNFSIKAVSRCGEDIHIIGLKQM